MTMPRYPPGGLFPPPARPATSCSRHGSAGRPPLPAGPVASLFRPFERVRVERSSSLLELLLEPERLDEGLLRHLDPADVLHPPLALLLLLEELALAGDVAAVALGQHVLALRLDRLACDHPSTDGRLDRHVEQLPGDERAQLLGHALAVLLRLGPVDDRGEGVDGDAVEHDLDLHQLAHLVPGGLVVEAGVALGAGL